MEPAGGMTGAGGARGARGGDLFLAGQLSR